MEGYQARSPFLVSAEGLVKPKDVGILCMEVYLPTLFVSQGELEDYDGVSKGKYTIGLGQDELTFCRDNEDVVSMSLTAVSSLIDRHNINPNSIGRLEVGTESAVDKSKSIKSHIMLLFEEAGNHNLEGVDSTNACYGGTAALFNSLNWIESSSWDGRYALVVATDISMYASGPARPTGGAGAIAILLGPNAPLVSERSLQVTYSSHVYDFYKPNPACPFPTVDGKLSQTCYLSAVERCFSYLCSRFKSLSGRDFVLASDVDYIVCHSPYNKLVQKSIAWLVLLDFQRRVRSGDVSEPEQESESFRLLAPYRDSTQQQAQVDKDLEKAAMKASRAIYEAKVLPSTILPKLTGNTYCGSLYSALVSLLAYEQDALLPGKRLLLFSYGSGQIASMFTLRVGQRAEEENNHLLNGHANGNGYSAAHQKNRTFAVEDVVDKEYLDSLLSSRMKVSPKEFHEAMAEAEKSYGACDRAPKSSAEGLRPGSFHLTSVDSQHRRFYARTSGKF